MTEPAERLRRAGIELAGLAQTGLAFAADRYDIARYQRLRELSAEILATLASSDPAKLLAALELDSGYATPHLDVRGTLFDGDRVLLVQEASDGRWTLPGGWADPLDSPRAAVEREFAEEAGLAVRAERLAGVWDGSVSNGHSSGGAPFHIWKLFYLCTSIDPAATPRAGLDGETTDVGYFPIDDLPPLSTRRVNESQLRELLARQADPALPPYSD
ncbi:MAG TPA: NUDIX hydrolase N-terminal domain-containing protein [Mycobacteriales bacterium]|nr:NUDIX hydrolase N-terminal domain-containing protein [Mycobacteriales bacterium]